MLFRSGFLGEMKAAGNQKPRDTLHPYIMDLLLSDMVKGIKGAGYLPERNFSVFDLNENNLHTIEQYRPTFISDQIQATPREILRAPDNIKLNPQYQEIALDYDIDLEHFFKNGKIDNSHAAWENALAENPYYVIYAPTDLKNYKQRVIKTLVERPSLFLESPSHILKDQEILNSVIDQNPGALSSIPPASRTPALLESAVSKSGPNLHYVPEDERTPKLCKLAVTQSGQSFVYVPDHLRTPEICNIALHKIGRAHV